MITVHGFSYSNYYNIVKHVLLHKGLEFEEDLQFGNADEYLAVSPLGKVPAITTDKGQHLSESSVCLERNFADAINGLAAWRTMMADSDIARHIDADREANGPASFAYVKERFGV